MSKSLEVQWPLESTTVYGSIVVPDGEGPFPAVVMAAGSGPTDREWNSPLLPGENGSARLLAESLAEHGFATLRYDKRASGAHAMENMRSLAGALSMNSHREEYAGAVAKLASMPFIRPEEIFGLGNSEGTLHVLHYQLEEPAIPLAGIILAAPPGRPVAVVARSQLAEQAQMVSNGDALLALYDEAIGRFENGEPASPDAALPEGVQALIASLESPMNLPFSRELWRENTVPLITKIEVPVLVVIGKKDIQVDWRSDGEPLEVATADMPHIAFVYPSNANHLLKYESVERSALSAPEVARRYNADGTSLDPEALSKIVGWLRSCTRP